MQTKTHARLKNEVHRRQVTYISGKSRTLAAGHVHQRQNTYTGYITHILVTRHVYQYAYHVHRWWVGDACDRRLGGFVRGPPLLSVHKAEIGFGTPEEVASMVAWLCTEECSFSTGAVFDLSGGRSSY